MDPSQLATGPLHFDGSGRQYFFHDIGGARTIKVTNNA